MMDHELHGIRPGMDILMAGYAGWEGSVWLARRFEKELTARFRNGFLDPIIKEAECLHAEEEPLVDRIMRAAGREAGAADVLALHEAGEGGVFTALWDMAAGAGLGLRVFLDRIPIRQETVEVCEFLDVNPYQLRSGGAALLAVKQSAEILCRLEEEGIPAAVIGYFTDDHDRLVLFRGKQRFLEPFRGDSAGNARLPDNE